MKFVITTIIFLCFNFWVFAQCDQEIPVNGETILCPSGTSLLSTSEFSSYQWYQREWGSDTPKPIEGATSQTFEVTEAYVLSYISVEVSYDTCQEFSEEILIDQWNFLLPYVIHQGEYAEVINGTTYICPNHVFGFELGLPYTENITWYQDGNPIEGNNTNYLQVQETGSYTVSGAPKECPDYIVPLGLNVDVIVFDPTQIDYSLSEDPWIISIDNPDKFSTTEWYLDGELIAKDSFSLQVTTSGMYTILASDENGCESSETVNVIISDISNIESSKFRIYPNPASTELYIEDVELNASIQIMNSLGQSFLEQGFNGQPISIEMLPPGLYHLVVRSGNKFHTKPFNKVK